MGTICRDAENKFFEYLKVIRRSDNIDIIEKELFELTNYEYPLSVIFEKLENEISDNVSLTVNAFNLSYDRIYYLNNLRSKLIDYKTHPLGGILLTSLNFNYIEALKAISNDPKRLSLFIKPEFINFNWDELLRRDFNLMGIYKLNLPKKVERFLLFALACHQGIIELTEYIDFWLNKEVKTGIVIDDQNYSGIELTKIIDLLINARYGKNKNNYFIHPDIELEFKNLLVKNISNGKIEWDASPLYLYELLKFFSEKKLIPLKESECKSYMITHFISKGKPLTFRSINDLKKGYKYDDFMLELNKLLHLK